MSEVNSPADVHDEINHHFEDSKTDSVTLESFPIRHVISESVVEFYVAEPPEVTVTIGTRDEGDAVYASAVAPPIIEAVQN